MLGVELGYIELFDVDETNVEKLGEDNIVAGFAVALAVIVVVIALFGVGQCLVYERTGSLFA